MMNRLALILSYLLLVGLVSGQSSVRVAVAQIFCLDGDREGNFRRIENALEEAAQQGAAIVCFPEMSLLGWVNPDAHQLSFPIPGSDSDRLSELARQYQVYVCIGLGEKENENLYDAAILISDEGKILAKHRKNNILSELMDPPYTPGNGITVVDTKFGRIGLLICADTFLEDNLIAERRQHPDLVLIPYGWAAKEKEWPQHGEELHKTIRNAASKIACPIVGTDLVGTISHGPWTGQVYGGQSAVIDQNGLMLGSCRDRDRHVLVVDIELNRH